MSDRIIYQAPLRQGEELRATISEYQGKEYVHLRIYFTPKGGSEMRPGKGLALLREQFPLMVAALKALHAELHPKPADGDAS